MKDDPSHVRCLGNEDGTGPYEGVCEKCGYKGPILTSSDTALGLLNLHRKTREHSTNIQSQFRFTV